MKAFIILPKMQDINTYIKSLTSDKYYNIIKNLENKKVIFSLPKFEIKFGAELKPHFISLGMVEAFTNNAEFSFMKKENDIKIGRIIHKTFIKVDEEGTEAAAATAVVMRKRCFIPNNDPIMNVNHPFLFIIRADYLPLGHDILFISKVESLNNCSNSNKIKNVINSTNIPGTKLNISQIVKKKPISINQIKQSSKETNKKGNETNNKKIIVHPSSATSNKNKNIKGDIKVSTNITPAGKIQINKNVKISKESVLNKSRPVSSKMYK